MKKIIYFICFGYALQSVPCSAQDSIKTKLSEHLKFTERLITAARAVRNTAFIARAGVVTISGAVIMYDMFKSPAPETCDLVKEFCYKEAGRNDFKIKSVNKNNGAAFFVWGKTLYVPTGASWRKEGLKETLQKKQQLETEQYKYLPENARIKEKIEIERRIQQLKETISKNWVNEDTAYYHEELKNLKAKLHGHTGSWQEQKKSIADALHKNQQQLNLFRGILDHEMTHVRNYDCYRLPLLLSGSCVITETSWQLIRNKLELHFKNHKINDTTFKGIMCIGGRWIVRLAVPTALYTTAFFTVRQVIKKTIEAQADAGVRDDIDVLTAVEKCFRDRAKDDEFESKFFKLLNTFFDSHPSDRARADYFLERIDNLKKDNKNTDSKKL